MTRQDFLEELKQALTDTVPPDVMMDTYRYYSNYIEEQAKSGKTEAEVLEELGRPTLIARSVIAAQTGDRDVDLEFTEDGRTRKVNKGAEFMAKAKKARKEFRFDFRAWYAKLLFALIIIFLIAFTFVILKGVFFVFFQFGIPILLLLGIIYLILYFIK